MIYKQIILLLRHYKINVTQFEKALNVSVGTIRKAIKKEAQVGSDIAGKIVTFYPDINGNWLLTGEGEMLKPIETATTLTEPRSTIVQHNVQGNNVLNELECYKELTQALKKINELQAEISKKTIDS